MNVLLINTNREKTPAPAIPLGLCSVASSAAAVGHSVTVADICFSKDPIRRVNKLVSAIDPDVIGLSVRNIDNADSSRPHWYIPEIKRIVEACKRSSPVPVVLGGPAISIARTQILSYTKADYAVVGDGEEAFPALLRVLERNEGELQVSGVASRNGPDSIVPARVRDMDLLPPAQIHRWLGLNQYWAHGAAIPVQTKRGCHFECEYCTYANIEGSSYRFRSPGAVADEISELSQRFPGRTIEFVDSTFNCPEEHALMVCEEISRRDVKCSLQTMDFNPSACSPELIASMERAGFTTVGITAESGSDKILETLRKGFTRDDIVRAAERLQGTQMLRLWIFLFGGPEETEETARETLDFIERNLTERDLVYFTYGVRIYPGSGLQRRAEEEGVVSAGDDLLEPRFYSSRELSCERLWQMIEEAKFPTENVISASLANIRALAWAQRVYAFLRFKQPYWRYAPFLNRALGGLVHFRGK